MTLLCENILNIWSKGKCYIPVSERKKKSPTEWTAKYTFGETSDYDSVSLHKIRWWDYFLISAYIEGRKVDILFWSFGLFPKNIFSHIGRTTMGVYIFVRERRLNYGHKGYETCWAREQWEYVYCCWATIVCTVQMQTQASFLIPQRPEL